MKINVTFIIFGMFLVTFIPRLLPFIFMEKIKLSKKGKIFLSYIPYAALGAMIFPDSFTAVSSMPIASTIGIIAAFILSYFTQNIITVILFSISVTYGVILFVS